jgi:putative DNA methylase
LEALRLGCDAFASDLNPVATEILRVLLVSVGKHGSLLLSQFREAADSVAAEAEKALSGVYALDGDGARPLAHFWSRTAICEKPTCGAEIPLLSTLWLSKKPHRRRALRPVICRERGGPPEIEMEVFEPNSPLEVGAGFVKNARAVCPACGATLLPECLRAQVNNNRGGLDIEWKPDGTRRRGLRLNAVYFERIDGKRDYRPASEADYRMLQRADALLQELTAKAPEDGQSSIPTEPINPISPSPNARGLSAVTRYGISTFGQLFTARQRLVLLTFARIIERRPGTGAIDDDISRLLALTLSKRADYGSVCTRWHLTFEKTTCTFSKQALSNTWDFVEPIPTGTASGSFGAVVESVSAALKTLIQPGSSCGEVQQADACSLALPDESCHTWFTDPPYYDAIPYADLADFFLVWLKRSLPRHMRTWKLDKETGLCPKTEECVWNSSYAVAGKQKDGKFFEEKAASSFVEARRILQNHGVGCVVFAHKTTEGWEALLSGMVQARWVITASWPLATERRGRLQSQNSASLATSVHLVCRPRTEDLTGDWGEVLRELPKRVGDWMERLEREGIRGADLVFACIGPALEIFSRYEKVETPHGTVKTLAEYLEKVWEVVGRVALEQVLGTPEAQARNGGAGALEEDARLTALFLWTVQATDDQTEDSGEDDEEETADDEDEDAAPGKKKPGFTLIYDVARRFAQPLGIHLAEWEGRIIETKKGVVRLLPVRERSQQLFGEAGTELAADRIERVARGAEQLDLFSASRLVDAAVPDIAPKRGRKKAGVADEALKTRREATTLDRVHAAMLLQAGGRANALRSLLKSETERSPDFLRLANALSALYPKESEEKRLLDAMLLAAPR